MMRIRSVYGTLGTARYVPKSENRWNPLTAPLVVELVEEVPDMMRRRRPLRRAAVVGGVAVAAHHAGTKSAQAQAAEQGQDEQMAELQAQQAQPQSAPPPAAPVAAEVGGSDMVTKLENLKKLLDEGVLTQAEFDMEKQKLLAGT
jgi:hypothetical protein